jgi:hypothetical protein
MYKIKKRFARTYLGLLFCWLCLIGCATSPAPITDKSGDSDFAQILESIRQKENCTYLFGFIILQVKPNRVRHLPSSNN